MKERLINIEKNKKDRDKEKRQRKRRDKEKERETGGDGYVVRNTNGRAEAVVVV